jgi:hypothetical protein
MTPLSIPVSPPMWALAELVFSRSECRAAFGEPHYVETDPRRTTGGEEDNWAYLAPSGQRVLVVLDVVQGVAMICADPPELEPILDALGIARDDRRLRCYIRPCCL